MKYLNLALLVILITNVKTSFGQPGPTIPFSIVINPINKALELDPDNDEARVRRIELLLRGGNYEYDLINIILPDTIITEKNEFDSLSQLSDLQYLENRWKAGKNKEFLTSELIHSLYGEAYKESNPELSKKHYIKAAKFNKKQLYYEGIFNAYKKLNEIDSALIYHDSLNLLFYKNSTSLYLLERFWYQKIELLKWKKEFTQELVDYYNWLSTENFGFYEKVCQNTKKGEYVSKSCLESGLNFQYDLCEYYFKHKKFKQFELLVNHLDRFVPRNKHGVVLNYYPYHRQFKLAGDLALHKGENKKAINLYLEAANHQSFHRNTLWSAQILETNKDNPDAHILHGIVSVNASRQGGYWYETAIQDSTMYYFETAQMMGSKYYVINMMHFFNLVAKKEFIEAEKLLNKTIASNPFIPQLYDQKIELNRNLYWNKLITEEELEKRVKIIKEQVEELRIPLTQTALAILKL